MNLKKSGDVSKSQAVTQEKQVSLSAAKDRAQLTATTAMSVVHVALLKSLVDGGPDANRYYTIVIVLIGIALVVQVVIGILAIFVTHMRNYYKKYHSDMCFEWSACWCNCFSCCYKTTSNAASTTGLDNAGLDETTVEVVVGEDELGDGTARKGAETTEGPKWVLPEVTRDGLEAVTRDLHLSMSVRLLKAQLAAIEAEFELKTHNRQLERETKRRDTPVTDTRNVRGRPTDKGSSDVTNSLQAGQKEIGSVLATGQEADVRESERRIMEIEAEIVNCEEKIQQCNVIRSQIELLGRHVGDADADNILKRVQFWQNCINYLLYIVFICNAFITALGVTGGQSTNNGGNVTSSGIK